MIKTEVYDGVSKINVEFKDIPTSLFEDPFKLNFFRKVGEDEG